MQVLVKGKNVEVTPAMRDYATKKLNKLSTYFGEIKEAKVTQSTQKGLHTIEVLLEGDGILLRGEDRSEDMYASIDLVVEKLERQILKFKGKLLGKAHHKGARAKEVEKEKALAEAQSVDGTVPDDEEGPVISRVKRFQMKPMTPEEAAMQMELLHHDFFVFVNAETSQVSVVYKRNEGDYGLLEPDF